MELKNGKTVVSKRAAILYKIRNQFFFLCRLQVGTTIRCVMKEQKISRTDRQTDNAMYLHCLTELSMCVAYINASFCRPLIEGC